MREIPLSNGMKALVDDADYPLVSRYRWYALQSKDTNPVYAVTKMDRRRSLLMHRMIDGTPTGTIIDHIDGDGLNNQRANLRRCTHRQNLGNQRCRAKPTGAFRGVRFNRGRYEAQVCRTILGRFKDENEAVRAYDRAALEQWGDFARLNFPDERDQRLAEIAGSRLPWWKQEQVGAA